MLSLIVGTSLIAVAVAPILLPAISDLGSLLVVGGRRLLRSSTVTRRLDEVPSSSRLLFLIPAHDEEGTITTAVRSSLSQSVDRDHYDVIVVADNCSDRTAEVARNAGAICYERVDPSQPGKPRAIAWGLTRIDLLSYDAVVIVDADSTVDPEYGSAILRLPNLQNLAFQGFNGVSNPEETALTRLAALLSVVYYRFAYVLKVRSGLNAPLTGAGMGIGTAILQRYGWQAFTLGEDVEKYVFLTLRGVDVELISTVGVRSQEATNLGTASSQRQRWRSGRLQILGKYGRSIMMGRGLAVRQRLDMLAELLGFGPATQVAVAMLTTAAIYVLYRPGTLLLLGLAGALIARPLTYAVLALAVTDNRLRTLRALSALPIYIVWRAIQEILAVLNIRSSDWIRTARR